MVASPAKIKTPPRGTKMSNDKKAPTPNDQRSNVMNPNNPAFDASQANRADQLNPNNATYHRGRGMSAEQANTAASQTKAATDNRANQLNPNHAKSKGGGSKGGGSKGGGGKGSGKGKK